MTATNEFGFDSDWHVASGRGRAVRWQGDLRRAIADTSYIALRFSGWLAMTTLAALGVTVLFFLMLGNFTPLGFFSQVANLGSHFVAADAARRATGGKLPQGRRGAPRIRRPPEQPVACAGR